MSAAKWFGRVVCLLVAVAIVGGFPSSGLSGVVPVADPNVRAGLSPYNWVVAADSVSTAVCGASLKVGFRGTRSVALEVDTSGIVLPAASRFPILAWTVNGGAVQTHQLAAGHRTIFDTLLPAIERLVSPR